MENTNTIYLEKLRVTFPSEIIYEDTYNGSKMVVFRTNDITSSVNGYPSATYQYYAVFLPENTTVTHMGTTDKTNNDKIGKLKLHSHQTTKLICLLHGYVRAEILITTWVLNMQKNTDLMHLILLQIQQQTILIMKAREMFRQNIHIHFQRKQKVLLMEQ